MIRLKSIGVVIGAQPQAKVTPQSRRVIAALEKGG